MEVKLFYKTQRELASALNSIVDQYWDSKLSEEVMMENISKIVMNNRQKVIKHNDFTTILKQQCGKRRLEVVHNVIKMKHHDVFEEAVNERG